MARQGETLAPAQAPPSRDAPRSWRPAVGVGVVAALVMLLGADRASLWTDEAATVSAATRPWGELLEMIRGLDAVHATYYAFMHVWIDVFGTSEIALRSASALAVGAVAAGTWVLAERLGGRALAWWAAPVVVLLPRVAWMGAEARPFAFATAAAVWATVLLVAAVARGGAWRWAGYAVLVVLGALLNLYTVLLLPAHASSLLLLPQRRTAVRRWLVPAVAAGAVLLPFLVLAAGQTGQLGRHDMSLASLARNVVVNQWFLGETPSVYTRDAAVLAAGTGDGVWKVAAVLLAVLATLVVGAALVRWARPSGRSPEARAVVVWTVPWIVVPTAVLVGWALVSQTYSPRYLAFCAPAVAVLLAAALRAVTVRPVQVGVVLALVACAVPVLVSQRTENAKSGADWRQVSTVVAAACRPGDGVYFAPRAAPTGTTVRLTTRAVSVAYPEPFRELVDVTLEAGPLETDDLVGRSRLLQAAGDRLADLGTLCVVRRHDVPDAVRDADDTSLARDGWVVRARWQGPLDEVVVLDRGSSRTG